MTTNPTRRQLRKRGAGYDWRDHPEGSVEACDRCAHRARWSIGVPEDSKQPGTDFDWIVRAFACGQHLHGVLDALEWTLDAVQLYDLAMIPEWG